MDKPPKYLFTLSELAHLVDSANLIFDDTEALFVHSSQANSDIKLLCLTLRHCTMTLAVAILAKNGREKI